MKTMRWDHVKNALLIETRGVSFDEVAACIERGDCLAVVDHPNFARHPGQKMAVVALRGYAYLVPFDEHSDHLVLRTVIPSRQATQKYLKGK